MLRFTESDIAERTAAILLRTSEWAAASAERDRRDQRLRSGTVTTLLDEFEAQVRDAFRAGHSEAVITLPYLLEDPPLYDDRYAVVCRDRGVALHSQLLPQFAKRFGSDAQLSISMGLQHDAGVRPIEVTLTIIFAPSGA
ncbi:hypothetical protein JNJ66_03260 [Candidatus Saccharibacteria bacterium]|nr:hypothetical protein [Candidatus Saccharibacteria bacterium]